MENFIEEFYYGNINPQARGVEKNVYVQRELALLSEKEKLLTERLTGEVKKLFLDYVNAWDAVLGACDLNSFTVGFRIGAKFTYDTFISEDTQLAD